MEAVYIAVFFVTVTGIICAAVLCVASKLMHVKVDERIAALQEILPGVNCGVCGYPGCSGYAKALLSGGAKTNLCTPGGSGVLVKISGILGVEAGTIERKTAIVSCNGDYNTQKKKMEYKGIRSCEAAKALYGGENLCAFGCLGYGDCRNACPVSAICMENSLAHIIAEKCSGCGLCVKACPNNLILVVKAGKQALVACKNIEKGAVTRKKCVSGCIACTKCVKECPEGAITMADNLARIDYEKCTGCGHCINVCIAKCIMPREA